MWVFDWDAWLAMVLTVILFTALGGVILWCQRPSQACECSSKHSAPPRTWEGTRGFTMPFISVGPEDGNELFDALAPDRVRFSAHTPWLEVEYDIPMEDYPDQSSLRLVLDGNHLTTGAELTQGSDMRSEPVCERDRKGYVQRIRLANLRPDVVYTLKLRLGCAEDLQQAGYPSG